MTHIGFWESIIIPCTTILVLLFKKKQLKIEINAFNSLIYITDFAREGLRRPLFYVEITAHLQFSFWHRTTAVSAMFAAPPRGVMSLL